MNENIRLRVYLFLEEHIIESNVQKNYHPNLLVKEHRLKWRHPQIWQLVHHMGLRFVFKILGEANFSLIRKFYDGLNLQDEE